MDPNVVDTDIDLGGVFAWLKEKKEQFGHKKTNKFLMKIFL